MQHCFVLNDLNKEKVNNTTHPTALFHTHTEREREGGRRTVEIIREVYNLTEEKFQDYFPSTEKERE